MLAFVTSLRHPQNSVDYTRVEELLRKTLASVTAQTSDDFVVIVVGNKEPSFALPDRVHFVHADFPPPAPPTGAQTARAPFVWDKGTKIGLGLIAARRFQPDHAMIFDADDFVSNRLAAFAAANPASPGWVIRDGWMYSSARRLVRRQPDFNRTCGTSFVIPYEAYGVPDLPLTASQQEIADGYGERLEAILGAHRGAVEWYREHQQRIVAPLPFRGAVYHVDTGENHSGKAMTGVAIPPSARVRREFTLPTGATSAATYWDAFGPRAIAESVLDLARRVIRRLSV